jgi:peroxiredoxin
VRRLSAAEERRVHDGLVALRVLETPVPEDAVREFGIAQVYRGMSDVARRSALLIDYGGTVRCAWAYEDDELPDFDELLSAARALSESA